MTRLAVFVATVGYCGYFPIAPGTVGSAAGLVFYLIVWGTQSPAVELGLIVGGDVTVLQERMAIASHAMPQVQTD